MKFFTSVLLFIFSTIVAADSPKLAHVVKFSDYDTGSVEDWLQRKGFDFKADARRRDSIDLDVTESRFIIEAKRHAFGLMPNETVNVPEFTYVEIDWGVNKFPEGASYEQDIRNEAIMLMIFMGDERQPSGSMFIPDSPYFVGLFICHGDDRTNHPYVGSYFKKSGRYVCDNNPLKGETVTTRFNLLDAYRSYFDKEKDDDPAVSGIAISLDTKKAKDKGQSSAFIKEIRFYH